MVWPGQRFTSWRLPRIGIAIGCCGILALAFGRAPLRAAPSAPAHEKPIPDKIDFNRDVRPILSDNCYFCHGPDKNKRKADLRLDTKEGLQFTHDDVRTIVPGHPEKSELIRRLTVDDPDERMPDPKSNKRLSPREIAVLKKWIEQGAEYKGHWAYIPPVRAEVPPADDPGFVRNPIDNFILARLKEQGLSHAPEADKVTLIRRVSFDLIGLPPTQAEVDAFVADQSPDAYEKVVDRLLASPHFGERMAMHWLDLVRYADTIGYHSDNPMNVSPYRDWVIDAFNRNEHFDQFTIEQLAGDLLPNPTTEQKVASAYNRLLQTTEEGGAQAKEYEAKYAADRVRNVSTVWMAQTMGCCQCHDHKFDPLPTRDFYSMAAFFADVQEASVGRREAGMPLPDAQQTEQLKNFDERIAAAKKTLETDTPALAAAREQWEKQQGQSNVAWDVLDPQAVSSDGEMKLEAQPDKSVRVAGKFASKANYTFKTKSDLKYITGFRLEALADDALPAHGPGGSPNGNFVLTEFKVTPKETDVPDKAPAKGGKKAKADNAGKLKRASADFSQDSYPVAHAIDGKNDTGWAILPEVGKSHEAVFELEKPLSWTGGELTFKLAFQSQFPQHAIGHFRLSATASADPAGIVPSKVKSILAIAPEKRTPAQAKELADYYLTIAPALQATREEVASLQKKKDELLKSVRTCLVTTAGTPRTVRILARGNWQDDTGAIVTPAVPINLGKLDVQGRRATRLDLAKWLVSHDNPLTARVFVNRLWKLYFGQGISKTLEDLGSQGEWPTHPELLDWLAVEFRDSPSTGSGRGGWDMKHMVRLLVTSGTYRQSSKATPEQKEVDPYNRLYARQSRFRFDAEIVRDNALAVSGLLVDKIGGPSVFPYQPPGYWFALNFPPREWKNDTGDGLYRRGMYTHWQRSFPQPSLLAFDAPSREEAVCERNRSNIPQQALALLNDPTYVEASRALAEHVMTEGGADAGARLHYAFARVLNRAPREAEIEVLTNVLEKHKKEYAQDPAAAQKLLSVGEHPAPKNLDPAELAAWTSVSRVILNLSETITRY